MKAPLLEARGLEAGYGASRVLFGVDLTLARGEVATLLGRNGMGKTTTVRALLGVLPLRAGEVRFDGAVLSGHRVDAIARRGIATVPEGRQVFPNLSVHEHLVAFAARRGQAAGTAATWTPDAVYTLFPRLALRRRHLGQQLSGGEQQMLAIGRALTTHPDLLILDEATEGLAPKVRDEIWGCLARLREAGLTLLVIDKWLDRLLDLADHHSVLERGRVVWRGTSAAFRADPALAARYLGV